VLIFATLLVVGTIVLVLTGKDLVLRFGFVSAISVAIVWIGWFTITTVKGYFAEKRYLEVATTMGLHGGIVLLLVYFFWFFLSEFFQVEVVGSAPSLKSSKLVLIGALLIAISTVALFVLAFLTRHKKSTRLPGR
jgi:hypothetical protein